MIATLLAFLVGSMLGIAGGAMVLDAYHERQRAVLQTIDADASNERTAVRQELARSEAQRSQAEAFHAEYIRRSLGKVITIWVC